MCIYDCSCFFGNASGMQRNCQHRGYQYTHMNWNRTLYCQATAGSFSFALSSTVAKPCHWLVVSDFLYTDQLENLSPNALRNVGDHSLKYDRLQLRCITHRVMKWESHTVEPSPFLSSFCGLTGWEEHETFSAQPCPKTVYTHCTVWFDVQQTKTGAIRNWETYPPSGVLRSVRWGSASFPSNCRIAISSHLTNVTSQPSIFQTYWTGQGGEKGCHVQ